MATECWVHTKPWVRCEHFNGEWVAAKPCPYPDTEGIFEITAMHVSGGSITSPIDRPRLDWAFNEMVKDYLGKEKE